MQKQHALLESSFLRKGNLSRRTAFNILYDLRETWTLSNTALLELTVKRMSALFIFKHLSPCFLQNLQNLNFMTMQMPDPLGVNHLGRN